MGEARTIKPWQQMAASCAGAVATSLLMTPFDVVKTRLQIQQTTPIHTSTSVFGGCTRVVVGNGFMEHVCFCQGPQFQSTNNLRFSGTIDAFEKIARTEGLRSLWSGLSPTLFMSAPSTVIYFTAYDQLRELFAVSAGPYAPLLAGVLARTGAVTIISPLELMRTMMQSKQYGFGEIMTNVRSAVERYGLSTLWRGLGATLLRDVPFSGLYWTSYEYLKEEIAVRHPGMGARESFWNSFSAGALAGTVAATVTTPFDVVKTRKQSRLGALDEPHRSVGTLVEIRGIVRTQGFGGLFVGLLPRVAKVAPACAIMISSYELGKRFFWDLNARQLIESMTDFD